MNNNTGLPDHFIAICNHRPEIEPNGMYVKANQAE